MRNRVLDEYLSGEKLYGDDLSGPELEMWFEDEKEAYFRLRESTGHPESMGYAYHALNRLHGFQFLKGLRFAKVLGVGSAYGDEFVPLAGRIGELVILESAKEFERKEISGLSVSFVAPRASGEFPFPENDFDLITCLSVLHHIPNVSRVVGEVYRCLVPGGYALVREPIISLGDWRKPRPGLTPRERGIPLTILRQIISRSGFEVVSERKCMFQLTYNLEPYLPMPIWNSNPILLLDRLLCVAFSRNVRYHPTERLHMLRPTAVYFVIRKPHARHHRHR